MCPFASLQQRFGSDVNDVIGCPALASSAAKSPQQSMTASEQPSPLHVGTRGSMCPWQQATSNNSMQPALPHNTSLDSLVDETTAFSIPALVSSNMSSSRPVTTDLRPDSSSTVGLEQSASAAASNTSSNHSDSDRDCHTTHQHWQLVRPQLANDPKLTRRQLRHLDKSWSLADVAQHKYCDDGWIAVDGKVYDITEHLVNHPGWESGCQVSTVLSIIAHLGIDCSEEFREIHRPYPVAWKQLQAYYIGDLA